MYRSHVELMCVANAWMTYRENVGQNHDERLQNSGVVVIDNVSMSCGSHVRARNGAQHCLKTETLCWLLA